MAEIQVTAVKSVMQTNCRVPSLNSLSGIVDRYCLARPWSWAVGIPFDLTMCLEFDTPVLR